MARIPRRRSHVQGGVSSRSQSLPKHVVYLKSLIILSGLAPNEKGMPYTIPTVKIDGKLIMDSINIAPVLEKLQPSPPLHFDSPMTGKVQDAVNKAWGALALIALPNVPRNILNPTSKTYFEETREKRFGMPLDELEKTDKAKNAWQDAEAGLDELKTLLREESGPFFLGKEPSYSDFIAVGAMQFMKRCESSLFERFVAYDQSFLTLYEACGKWLERDDH